MSKNERLAKMERSNPNSLTNQKVFGPVVQTLGNIKPVKYKWVFMRKRNENDEIIGYKA